ncbi:protein EVI2B-like [Centroberyx affinis]|uniref:protein EVI2B-like n=1 Tax=Centroberyx affinis TaxID=166261 RepID=UPI003A5C05CF
MPCPVFATKRQKPVRRQKKIMRRIYFVSLLFLWLMPLTVNGTVTPRQNHNFTTLRTGEVTASKKSFTFLNMIEQHLTSELQAQDPSKERKASSLPSFSTGRSPTRAKRNASPSDGQTTKPSRSSVNISTMKPEGVSPTLHSKDSGAHFTSTIMGDLSLTEAKTTNSPGPLQPSAPTKNSVLSLLNQSADIQRAPTPISILSQSNSSTEGTQSTTPIQFKLTSSAMVVNTTQANNSRTEATTTAPLPSTFSQSPGTKKTSNPLTTTDQNLTSPVIGPTQTYNTKPTTQISTEKTSTKPVVNNSTNAGTVTGGGDGGGATQQTEGTTKAPTVATKIPFITTTKAKKKPKPPLKPDEKAEPNKGKSHGTAVAWIIGGALVLMMIGFLVIYVKKRKLQKQQINTRDWAGPSPFLDSGTDGDDQVELRSSNRISLSSFLPQRLSRRLSLLQETDEELEDIKPSSTFGDNHPGSTFGKEVAGDELQARNATAAVVPEKTQMGEAPEIVEAPIQVTSSQTNDPLSTNDPPPQPPASPLEIADVGQHHSATPPALADAVDANPPPLLDDGLEQT